MRKYIVLTLLLSVCFALFADLIVRPKYWATPIVGANLNNMYWVDEGVYRSEQPSDNDFIELSKFGITDVLNLREYRSDNDGAQKSNLILHRVKMNAGAVTEQQIFESLKIIKNRKRAILVHCLYGSDRTGVTIASYRIVFNDWSKEQAIDEMINGGFGYHYIKFPNLVTLINDLDVNKIKKKLSLKNTT